MTTQVRALELLRSRGGGGAAATVELTLAGGYDPRLRENVATYDALQATVARAGLDAYISLERNVSEERRRELFERSHAVVYTVRMFVGGRCLAPASCLLLT